ncbi:uncharacterized protein MKZ38_009032 [Zalerion maritima]|uniref:Uncharacterized protein n=1 Tax=Zalerion maritima TaxID=339359 RepID=A0AAD5RTU6_9PEZI|nr:uncharacterized protein MKZ38_009032 [Zalerion maritima]
MWSRYSGARAKPVHPVSDCTAAGASAGVAGRVRHLHAADFQLNAATIVIFTPFFFVRNASSVEMDFWSRLVAQAVPSRSSRKDAAKDPVKRLHRFEKEYSQLLQIWRNSSNLAQDDDAALNLEIRLQELTDLLRDESHRPLPHPCIQFSSGKQIYVPIAKIATTSYNESIIHVAVHFFATLIESEEEAFVENHAFASSLTNLIVKITGPNSIRLARDTETKVVQIAFNITTKLRLDPDILPAWFKQQQSLGRGLQEERQRGDREKFAGRTQKQDFPVFYLLMDYIHHEGKIGDFARTGLLYIIEAASTSVDLEQWIVESDLSTLMATGLGALYSQLSRKLVIDHPPHDLPPILALSDYQHPTSTFEIVSSCSPDYQSHMDTFLSHLLFWQDVLNHCKSVHVKKTLLEHFQVIFLQQLLYPSLLESSDIDGGSSVAVLTYLRRILETLDHPDMINLILHYLLGLPDTVSAEESSSKNPVAVAQKRKSIDLLSMMAQKAELDTTPMLFNLVDMVLACLHSRNQQTIHVTLQLVSTILKRHHRYAVITLLRTESVTKDAHRTIGAHKQEVEYFMSLAGVIGGLDHFDEIYDNILKDTMTKVEGHPCSLKLVAPKLSTNNHKLPAIPDSLPGAPRDVREHTLRPQDPLLQTLIDILATFFVNPVETNLAATETLVDLAACGFMSVEGWFSRDPQKYIFDEDTDSPLSPQTTGPQIGGDEEPIDPVEMIAQRAMQASRRRPRWIRTTLPRLLVVMQTLVDGVATYKETVPRFEDLLQQRREAFQTADAVLNQPPSAVKPASRSNVGTPAPSQSEESMFSGSPARPSALEGFAQRILSELGTPSRSGSPRGRRDHRSMETPERPSRDGIYGSLSGGYGISTPTARPIPVKPPPGQFPLNHDNPRQSGGRSFSPQHSHGHPHAYSHRTHESSHGHGPHGHPGASSIASDDMWAGSSNDAVESQKEAFAAVDQSILNRKIGMPQPSKPDPIPLNLEKAAAMAAMAASSSSPAPAESSGSGGGGEAEGVETDESRKGSTTDTSATVGDRSSTGETTEVDEGSTMVIGGDDYDEDEDETQRQHVEEKTVTVSHVITNVIILQAFLFELASLLQVRAGLFEEVRFV